MQTKDTYNMILPPRLEDDYIIFAFSKYYIDDKNMRSALFRGLSQAIKQQDYGRMYEILGELDEYRIKTDVKPQYKQSLTAPSRPAIRKKEENND